MGAPCAALLTVRVMSSCHVTDGHADSLLYGVYVGVCVVYYLVNEIFGILCANICVIRQFVINRGIKISLTFCSKWTQRS